MISTFKETWTSVRDLSYGQKIISKTVGQAFWYWFKYVLLIASVIAILAISALTYFTPQIPKLVKQFVPDISVSIKDGQLSTNAHQPLELKSEGFTFILNTEGQPEEIDELEEGVLVLQDRVIVKDQTQTRTFEFSEFEDEVNLDKSTIVSWLEDNKVTLLSVGVLAVVLMLVFGLGMYVVWYLITFLVGGLVLWLVGLVLKKGLAYVDGLKLAMYAAVPALIVSLLFTFSTGSMESVIVCAVWAIFGAMWVYRLPSSKKSK